MCTAATYQTKDFYFGRTLDYDVSYGNRVVLTPRGFTFRLRNGKTMIYVTHYERELPRCVDKKMVLQKHA